MEQYNEPNEKLMLIECIEEDWGFKIGELCWAVTEHNSTYNNIFYKVIDNVRHVFLNHPNKFDMLEMFKIIDDCEITFMEKQAWAYGDMRKRYPEYFPASKEKFKEYKIKVNK